MPEPNASEVTDAAAVRVGIDVGGTFTHAIAIDSSTLSLLGKAKVPTTHAQGVARGIIDALQKLLSETDIAPERVGFIAHSTTQATNALLEGDVVPVGILGMGAGANAPLASLSTRLGKIELAPQKFLTTFHRFIDTTRGANDKSICEALEALVKEGAKAIAVSEAYSVDNPLHEERALTLALEMGLYATAGSQVSQLYGLKVRTRTAVINAAMLPKMIESADMTERSVREAGITAPVMIMRSDGGVMDIDAMRKRPILTMLSGPAAGVAAAMMFLNISDGIFVEVGGTSTDISAISNGRAQVRSGEVGGHKVYMRTLDVRTVGVAGGSLPRISGMQGQSRSQSQSQIQGQNQKQSPGQSQGQNHGQTEAQPVQPRAKQGHGKIFDVGPRSAHIAGLKYISFSEPLENPRVTTIAPKADDPKDYLAFSSKDGKPEFCLTPTCAANLLGLVPSGDCAQGNREAIDSAFSALSEATGKSDLALADEILSLAAKKCMPVVQALIKDHKLDKDLVALVGGGGGAAAIVPFLGRAMGLRHSLAEEADVISAIGVALALIRETVERQIVNPTADDILKIRADAHATVEKMGASPESIDVQVEVDARTSTVRATAQGAARLQSQSLAKNLSEEERIALAADSMRVDKQSVRLELKTKHFQVYSCDRVQSELFGLVKQKKHSFRVLDATGTIRLQFQNGHCRLSNASQAQAAIKQVLDELSEWGDAGKVLPDTMLLAGPKIIDLSGLLDESQVLSLAQAELDQLSKDSEVAVLARLR